MTTEKEHRDPAGPSTVTLKRLFASSGNKCAFPKCSSPIIQGKTVVGEICHIRAANKGGPRYDSSQTAIDRHGYDNLILLCRNHHAVTDDDQEAYTVDRLIKMKSDHEQRAYVISDVVVDDGAELLVAKSVMGFNQSGGITAHTVNFNINSSSERQPVRDKPNEPAETLDTIRFDYLPISPTEKGWTKIYRDDGAARFGTDHDIEGSLRMDVTHSEFAMDYQVPVHATLANRITFTAKYTNSVDIGAVTMIFAFIEVSTKNGEQPKRLWMKINFGKEKSAFQSPGGWQDGKKKLPEQTLYWPAQHLGKGRLKFDVDLPEAVRVALGAEGWIYKAVYKFRLRGNLSISPIEFASLNADNRAAE
jgi:hypothetical protein